MSARKSIKNIIDDHEFAYTGELTPTQAIEFHFVQALLKLLAKRRHDACQHFEYLPSREIARLLNIATSLGDESMVEIILGHAPSLSRGEALVQAAGQGEYLCMLHLLPASRGTKKAERALRQAALNGHVATVERMSEWSDPDPLLVELQAEGNTAATKTVYEAIGDDVALQKLKARISKEELIATIGEQGGVRAKRRM